LSKRLFAGEKEKMDYLNVPTTVGLGIAMKCGMTK
jgi:hypothetical protein